MTLIDFLDQHQQEEILDSILQSLPYVRDDGRIAQLIADYLDFTPTHRIICRSPPELYHQGAWACCITASGEFVVTGNYDGTLNMFDSTTGTWIRTFEGHTHRIHCCCLLAEDTRLVSGSRDNTLKVWDMATAVCVQTLQGHTDAVVACCGSSDGTVVVSASADHTLRMWDRSTGTCLHEFVGHTDTVTACTLSSSGSFIVSASANSMVKIWDVSTETCTRTLFGHHGFVTSCWLFAEDYLHQYIVSTAFDFFNGAEYTLKLWDVATGLCTHTVPNFGPDFGSQCTMSADTHRIAAFNGGRIQVWNRQTGDIQTEQTDDDTSYFSMCFSSNGKFLVCGTEHGVEFRDAITLQRYTESE